jgi:hypothetical protein
VSLMGRLLDGYLGRLDRRLAQAARNPVEAQNRVLSRLLSRAQATWFARQYALRSVRTPADFARAIPIRDYVADLDVFRRVEAGEPDVCWPGRVRNFAQTSGTTAGDKHIPITPDMTRSNRRAALAIFAYYRRWNPANVRRLMDGQLLFLGGSTALERTPTGARIGDLSGIATRSIFWPLSRRYEPGKRLALMDSWEEKVSAVARRAAGRDVRFVTGMPSWVRILFDRLCAMRGIPAEGGMSQVWPNLRLFVHGGVNFAPYRSSFQRYFRADHPLDFQEVYPASEGFVAIQAEAGKPGMEMLTDNGLYYEFVPLEEWGSPSARRLSIGEVEVGVPYSLVLSTCAGLWAYDIGDVVRFVSLRPPRIVFAGRNKHFINAFGENVIGEQVSAAAAAAATATGAQVEEFTVAPRYPDAGSTAGGHEWVVEFTRAPAGGVDAFALALDAELQRLNHDYSIKRKGGLAMAPPTVKEVGRGAFYNWMKARGKLGGQHKVPICANDRRYVEELV